MKTLVSLSMLLSLLLFLQGCSEEQVHSERFVVQSEMVDQQPEPGVVPQNHPVLRYLQTEENDWRDLDAFYREQILEEGDKPYAESLKKMAISILVEAYPDFLQEASADELAFYIDQQRQLDLVMPDVFLACLKAMEKYKDKGELAVLAAEVRERNMAHVKAQFADSQAVLARMESGLEQLLEYSREL